MKRIPQAMFWLALSTMITIAPTANAQSTGPAPPVFVFPAEGQDPEQQREDRLQCQGWAAEQSGYDPSLAALSVYLYGLAAASTGASAAAGKDGALRGAAGGAAKGSLVRGAAGGAAVAALIGALSDDVSTGKAAAYGAGAGAAGGALRGRLQQKGTDKAAAAEVESLAQQTRRNLANYGRAYKTCLEGRGYSIS